MSNIYPGGYKFPGNVAVANMNSNNQLNYNRCSLHATACDSCGGLQRACACLHLDGFGE